MTLERSENGEGATEAPSTAVDLRYNLFLITRPRRDEVRTTRYLAALWRREPVSIGRFLAAATEVPALADIADWDIHAELVTSRGRLDLVLEAPGEALVVIEAKIDSGLGRQQLQRYRQWLVDTGRTGEQLVLLYLTKDHESLPDDISAPLDGRNLIAKNVRWRDLADQLVESRDEDTLASDFVAMLAEEGLAVEPGVTPADWDAWNSAARTVVRLSRIVAGVAVDLYEHSPGVVVGSARIGRRKVDVAIDGGDWLLELGVAANSSSRHPTTPPIAYVRARRRGVSASQKAEAAEAVVGVVETPRLTAYGGWVQRHTAAEELFDAAADGSAQQAALLQFCRETISALAAVSFIPAPDDAPQDLTVS